MLLREGEDFFLQFKTVYVKGENQQNSAFNHEHFENYWLSI